MPLPSQSLRLATSFLFSEGNYVELVFQEVNEVELAFFFQERKQAKKTLERVFPLVDPPCNAQSLLAW